MKLVDWVVQGRKLGVMGRSAAWWIGDWLRYGNLEYGEKYMRAARITGYDVQSLMNMVYVASHFDASRRRETLSWSHHSEVAALPREQQERWLDRASDRTLAVRCLRDELRRARRRAVAEQAEAQASGEAQAPVAPPEPPLDATLAHAEPAADDHSVVCPDCGRRFEPDEPEGQEGTEGQTGPEGPENAAPAAIAAVA